METIKKKILILGATGFFGSNACIAIKKKFTTCALINKNDFYLNGIKKIYLKDNFFDSIEKIIIKIKPDLIINSIGFTDIDNELNSIEQLEKLNFLIPNTVSKLCKKFNIKLVHISTDQLYNDDLNLHTEKDKLSPVNLYGSIKIKAEKKILSNDNNSIIVRTNFFGCNRLNKNSLFDFIYSNLKSNKKIFMYDDILFTPIYVRDLIKIIIKLYEIDYSGIVNVSSNEIVSKYDFALLIANQFGLNSNLIVRTNFSKKKIFKIKRSKNMTLSNKKLKKVIKNLDLSIKNSIQRFHWDYSHGSFNEIVNHLNYSRHYIPRSTIKRVSNVLNYENLTQGKQILEFESIFSKIVGSKYAVAVSSCTAGLHISSKVLGLSKNNNLLTSPNTFVSSANIAYYLNSKVFFSDIDNNSPNISIDKSKKLLDDKKNSIKVFIPVHYSGITVNLINFQKYRKNGLKIIEDAAHALGSRYECGSPVGSCKYSDVTVFSFHPVKTITTGEGGMITTNDKNIYQKLLMLRTHGINQEPNKNVNKINSFTNKTRNPWYFEMQELGFHYRMTDIQAAIGIEQLMHLEKFIQKRKKLSLRYIEYFKNSPIKTYDANSIYRSACHLFNIRIKFNELKINKADFINKLRNNGIGCQVHYIPIPLHPFYQKRGFKIKNYPNTLDFYEQILSIPLFYKMTTGQQRYVKDCILKLIK